MFTEIGYNAQGLDFPLTIEAQKVNYPCPFFGRPSQYPANPVCTAGN